MNISVAEGYFHHFEKSISVSVRRWSTCPNEWI